MLLTLLTSAALAEPVLVDAGRQRLDSPVALVVATPCVAPTAWLGWVEALEGAGLDAWIVFLEPRGQDPHTAAVSLRSAAEALAAERGPLRIAAHGHGGVLALMAELPAERWALVGTPLGPQAAPVVAVAPAGPVVSGLPWPTALTGVLPTAVCAGELSRAYVGWTTALGPLPPPPGPTLVLASDLDVVAPPETVRGPSQDWPGREWHRVGIQSLLLHDPTHAELLLDPRLAARVADFLAEGL